MLSACNGKCDKAVLSTNPLTVKQQSPLIEPTRHEYYTRYKNADNGVGVDVCSFLLMFSYFPYHFKAGVFKLHLQIVLK